MRRPLAVLTALLLAAVMLCAGATAASAHDHLESSNPAAGSTVAVAPASVTLTFDLPALALGTKLLVTGPGGETLSRGEPTLVNSTVTQDLAETLPAGRYTVDWRVTSADGHPVSGQFTFTASTASTSSTASTGAVTPTPTQTAPAAQTPTEASTSGGGSSGGGSSGRPLLVAAIGFVVLIGGGLALVLARRRPGARGEAGSPG